MTRGGAFPWAVLLTGFAMWSLIALWTIQNDQSRPIISGTATATGTRTPTMIPTLSPVPTATPTERILIATATKDPNPPPTKTPIPLCSQAKPGDWCEVPRVPPTATPLRTCDAVVPSTTLDLYCWKTDGTGTYGGPETQ